MKVSVCMATYNGANFISKQLSSILSQLRIDDEVIIIDDNSTDDTITYIKSYNDKRINLVINKKNSGVLYSFNKALSLATGEIIFFSDQDDEWEENKVSHILDIFQFDVVDLIIHDAVIVSQNKIIHPSLFKFANSRGGFFYNLFSNTYTGCCMAFRAPILKKIMPIPQINGVYHDSWIGILSELYGFKTKFIETPLIRWNRHENNTSSINRRSIKKILIDRVCFIFVIFRHIFLKKNL